MEAREAARLAKNERIREAGKATRARRAKLDCRVYHLKLYPTKNTRERLVRLFLEAKWLRNAAIAASSFQVSFLEEVRGGCPVRTPSGVEYRELRTLGSQMKQGVLSQLRGDLQGLSASKKKGRRVGRLRFTSEVRSINLQQYDSTYALDFERKRARVQNIGWVKARGWHQLAGYSELANAKLLQKPDGFYLAITAYFDSGMKDIPVARSGAIGVDMGVSTHLTLSDGRKVNSTVRETERSRRLQRKLSRQVKGSNNRRKTLLKLRREHQKLENQKRDFANKVAHDLLGYEEVFFQDENLSGWRRRNGFARGGKRLQHSALGLVKAKLKAHPRAVMLSRWEPTTQYCPSCEARTKHGLDQRTFTCSSCGLSEDRDVHAAKNMIILGTNTSGTGGSACGGRVRPSEASSFAGQRPAKQETAWSSAAP